MEREKRQKEEYRDVKQVREREIITITAGTTDPIRNAWHPSLSDSGHDALCVSGEIETVGVCLS